MSDVITLALLRQKICIFVHDKNVSQVDLLNPSTNIKKKVFRKAFNA